MKWLRSTEHRYLPPLVLGAAVRTFSDKRFGGACLSSSSGGGPEMGFAPCDHAHGARCVGSLLPCVGSRALGGPNLRTSLTGIYARMVLMFPGLARFRSETIGTYSPRARRVRSHACQCHRPVLRALPSALLLGIATTAFLRVVLPPAGVYLASSDPERISFFGQLNRRTSWFRRVVAQVSNSDPIEWPPLGKQVGLQNDFRTTDPSDWPDVVKQVIGTAALVVVDGRDRSPGLSLRSRYSEKSPRIQDRIPLRGWEVAEAVDPLPTRKSSYPSWDVSRDDPRPGPASFATSYTAQKVSGFRSA